MNSYIPFRARADLVWAWRVAELIGGGLLAGCQTVPPGPPPLQVQPLDASVGHVAKVNVHLGFVVLDFTLSRPPQPGDRLEVSRAGRVVAELKTGFHQRGTTLAADLISGSPEVGDEVRPLAIPSPNPPSP